MRSREHQVPLPPKHSFRTACTSLSKSMRQSPRRTYCQQSSPSRKTQPPHPSHPLPSSSSLPLFPSPPHPNPSPPPPLPSTNLAPYQPTTPPPFFPPLPSTPPPPPPPQLSPQGTPSIHAPCNQMAMKRLDSPRFEPRLYPILLRRLHLFASAIRRVELSGRLREDDVEGLELCTSLPFQSMDVTSLRFLLYV